MVAAAQALDVPDRGRHAPWPTPSTWARCCSCPPNVSGWSPRPGSATPASGGARTTSPPRHRRHRGDPYHRFAGLESTTSPGRSSSRSSGPSASRPARRPPAGRIMPWADGLKQQPARLVDPPIRRRDDGHEPGVPAGMTDAPHPSTVPIVARPRSRVRGDPRRAVQSAGAGRPHPAPLPPGHARHGRRRRRHRHDVRADGGGGRSPRRDRRGPRRIQLGGGNDGLNTVVPSPTRPTPRSDPALLGRVRLPPARHRPASRCTRRSPLLGRATPPGRWRS